MQDYFFALADELQATVHATEALLIGFVGEESDFVRFNCAKVRQAGHVTRRSLSLDLIDTDRHATGRLELAGSASQDLPRVRQLIEDLRAQRAYLPPDPFLNYASDGQSGERHVASSIPDAAEAIATISDAASGLDLVGIWASGDIHTGFASSHGQRNWHSCGSFNFDWSGYHAGDKAAKANYAGRDWDSGALQRRMDQVRSDLALIARRPKRISPGRYRVYLSPRALQDVLEMMAWGGFGLKSQRTGQSPLMRLQNDELRLHPSITVSEDRRRGLAPHFTPQGFVKPDRVSLIRNGRHDAALVDSRSAREYGVAVNAAGEYPTALDMAPGDLPSADVLDALDTGLLVNNLWYLNFSDRNAARITGMTRFACFWVEHGRIQAPVDVMRFDDSIYRMLGDNLLGLTRERELMLDTGTYGGRSNASAELPGALIDDLVFTL